MSALELKAIESAAEQIDAVIVGLHTLLVARPSDLPSAMADDIRSRLHLIRKAHGWLDAILESHE